MGGAAGFDTGDVALAIEAAGEGLPGVLYKVKVMAVQHVRDKVRYKVHFMGWKSQHDSWVDELKPLTAENLALKKELQAKAQQVAKEIKAARARERSMLRGKSTKRARLVDQGPDEAHEVGKSSLNLTFSAALKKHVFDDYENVSTKKMLLRVPARTTIEAILEDYAQDARKPFKLSSATGRGDPEAVKQVLDGIKVLFERALGPFLLYAFERLQYEAIREKHPESDTDHLIIVEKKRKRLVQLYGCEHLLRFLLKLPQLISPGELISYEAELLQDILNDLLKYISKNKDRYLRAENFVHASNDYINVLQDK